MATLPGWSFPGSPFHPGGQRVQQRLGVRERMEAAGGRRVLATSCPTSTAALRRAALPRAWHGRWRGPAVAVGCRRRAGLSLDPDEHTLRLAASRPLGAHLRDGGDIGVLGIDFAARRATAPTGWCARSAPRLRHRCRPVLQQLPEIHPGARLALRRGGRPCAGVVRRGRWLGAAERALVAGADTFFLHRQRARQRPRRAEPRRRRLLSRRPARLRSHR